jgi:hypothetical protein
MKAFLSHSSKDKDNYVRRVADWLGKDNIIYDEFTFEEGEKPLDEIIRGLDITELFVLFISNNSLNSDWVKKEIIEAKTRLDASLINKFFPIIIEDGLTYEDTRIPDWLRDNYNLQPIKRAQVAAKRIHNKLRELSWSKHPNLKKRQDLFVGRNEKLEEFESRIDDYEKKKPIVIIASGITGVGRRTFLHKALCKTNITKDSHKPSAIVLDRNVSIEDFIFKLNDLGLIDFGDDILSLTSKSIDEKIAIIHKIMKAAYDAKEVIYLVDEGSIVNYKRELSEWFIKTINLYKENFFPIFCIASRHNVSFKSRPRNEAYYFIELNELNFNERKRLLNRLLEIEKIELKKNDFDDVSSLLFGLPEQVMFAVDILRQDNLSSISLKLPTLREYNSDKASAILKKYEKNDNTLSFIRLLAQFEVISSDFVFSIVSEKKYYPILEELAAEHIIDLIGIEGEIIRLNDIIRDYIKRNKLKIKSEWNDKIKSYVKDLVKGDDIFERDSSEFIFTLKESLKSGVDIDEKFLIPSHYLRCMKDMYYNKENLDKIIRLADVILQKKQNLEIGILQDIRYYLCLALAKKKDDRMLQEVKHINGNEHIFLLGFYYRLSGRYKEALDKFIKIIDAPYIDARAKREIVQVYVHLDEFDKALDFARKNYEENRGNQFHTQAYFNCLINSENPEKHKDILQALINNLYVINSEQSKEMADIAEALFYAKVNHDKQLSLDKIADCVKTYTNNHYSLLAFCDIAIKYLDKDLLKEGIQKLEKFSEVNYLSDRTLNKYKVYYFALDGKEHEALKILEKYLSRYPTESKERTISKIKEYCKKSKVPV